MKNLFKSLCTLLLFALLSNLVTMQGAPKREFRSTWIATVSNINWPSTKGTSASVIAAQKAEMDKYIEDLAKEGFTSICFQARSMCDAMYKSSYDPWSSYLTGTRGTD